jgi:hypothetical protein
VLAASELPTTAPLVAAGCGGFLVRDLATRLGRPCLDYADAVHAVPPDDTALARRADLCAPALAVALLAAGT